MKPRVDSRWGGGAHFRRIPSIPLIPPQPPVVPQAATPGHAALAQFSFCITMTTTANPFPVTPINATPCVSSPRPAFAVYEEKKNNNTKVSSSAATSIETAPWSPLAVSVANSSDEALREAFEFGMSSGILILEDVIPEGRATDAVESTACADNLMSTVRDLFDVVSDSAEVQARANAAYAKNLVFKDSFARGTGGDGVDQKRCIDLSPERLAQIHDKDPSLAEEMAQMRAPLAECVTFFESVTHTVEAG